MPSGPRQRTLCHLGQLNGSAHSHWLKTIEVFNQRGESRQLKLFPSDLSSDKPRNFSSAPMLGSLPSQSRYILLNIFSIAARKHHPPKVIAIDPSQPP